MIGMKRELKQDSIHIDHNQLDHPLPFQIICTNIVL